MYKDDRGFKEKMGGSLKEILKPCPSMTEALRIMGPVPFLGSVAELALVVGAKVSRPQGHERWKGGHKEE